MEPSCVHRPLLVKIGTYIKGRIRNRNAENPEIHNDSCGRLPVA